jgi:hypothetical protein
MERRIKKYDKFLDHIRLRNMRRESIDYMTAIFRVWKNEYQGARRLFVVLDTNQYWDSIRKGMKEIKTYIQLIDNTFAREAIISRYMIRKNEDLKRLALRLFRYKVRVNNISQLNMQIGEAQRLTELSRAKYMSYAPLVSKAKSTFRIYTLLKTSYLRFKKYSQKRKLKHTKIHEMQLKINNRVKSDIMKLLNWRRYFKQTSRDYVQSHHNQFDYLLTRDTFLALKLRREKLK